MDMIQKTMMKTIEKTSLDINSMTIEGTAINNTHSGGVSLCERYILQYFFDKFREDTISNDYFIVSVPSTFNIFLSYETYRY